MKINLELSNNSNNEKVEEVKEVSINMEELQKLNENLYYYQEVRKEIFSEGVDIDDESKEIYKDLTSKINEIKKDIKEYEDKNKLIEEEESFDYKLDCMIEGQTSIEEAISNIEDELECVINETRLDYILSPYIISNLVILEKDGNYDLKKIEYERKLIDLTKLGKKQFNTEYNRIKKVIEDYSRSQKGENDTSFANQRDYERETEERKKYFIRDERNFLNFKEGLVAEEILKEEHFMKEIDKVYIYDNGRYSSEFESKLNKIIKDKLGKYYFTTLRSNTIKSMVLAEVHSLDNMEKIQIQEESRKLDKIINFKNGLLNWETGKFTPNHSPKFYSKNQLPFDYNPNASTKFARDFLENIIPKDALDTILEYIGYCLTTKTDRHVALILFGKGENGKSGLIEYISNLIGRENILNRSLEEFETDNFAVADLHNKLLNVGAEISDKILNETTRIKRIIGFDTTTAQHKGKDSFNFKPYAKHIYSANSLPRTSDISHGFFRRWLICPFPYNLKKLGRVDVTVWQKIKNEENLQSLCMLALEGLRRLEKNGNFSDSKSIREVTEKYINENKLVKKFIDEKLTILEGYYDVDEKKYKVLNNTISHDENEVKLKNNDYIQVKDLYELYKEYCKDNNFMVKNVNNFLSDIELEINDIKERKNNRVRKDKESNTQIQVYMGIFVGTEEEFINKSNDEEYMMNEFTLNLID